TDPEQYGDSLIGLGNVLIYGATKTSYARLAVEPKAGSPTLRFVSPVRGWRVGDELFLPDTRQLRGGERGGAYLPEYERPTIVAISCNGLTVTLSQPLQYDHPGARDGNGVLEFLPQVANLTRNVVIGSQNGRGTRGIVMFLQRANVDIRNTYFSAL